MQEEWKDIEGYKDKYMVSNSGKIKSLKRKVEYDGGYYTLNEVIMKQKDIRGYKNITLSKNNKSRTLQVHRLVLEHFNPVKDMDKLQVNHIDGDKSNNSLSNLEWCTPKENTQHAIKLGKRGDQKGIKNPNSKLNPKQVKEIVEIRNSTGNSHSKISKKFNVSRKTVGNILNGKVWSHITGIEKCND